MQFNPTSSNIQDNLRGKADLGPSDLNASLSSLDSIQSSPQFHFKPLTVDDLKVLCPNIWNEMQERKIKYEELLKQREEIVKRYNDLVVDYNKLREMYIALNNKLNEKNVEINECHDKIGRLMKENREYQEIIEKYQHELIDSQGLCKNINIEDVINSNDIININLLGY